MRRRLMHVGADGDALLFPNSRGGHLNDKVFADSVFRPVLKLLNGRVFGYMTGDTSRGRTPPASAAWWRR